MTIKELKEKTEGVILNVLITEKGSRLSAENRYIRGVRLNGEPYDLPYIGYKDIVKGGTLEFTMGK